MNHPIVYVSIGLFISFASIVIFFLKPKCGIFLILFLRPILDNIPLLQKNYIFGSINYLQLYGMALPFLIIVVCLIHKINFFQYRPANIYLIFLVCCLPSIFFSKNIFLGLADWSRLFTFWPVFLFSINFVNSFIDFKRIFFAVVISSIYPIIKFSYDLIMGNYVFFGRIHRILGNYQHMSIISCMFLCFIPAFLFFIYSSKSSIKKKCYFLGLLLIILFLYSTQYRTALLGVVSLLFSLFIFRKNYLTAFLIVLIPIVAAILIPAIKDRFMPLILSIQHLTSLFDFENNTYDHLMSGRFGLWRNFIYIFVHKAQFQNFIFGFGYGFNVKYRTVSQHNDIIGFLFRYGLIASIAYIIFLFSLLRAGFKSYIYLPQQIILSWMISLIVVSMAHGTFNDIRNVMYMGIYSALLLKFSTINNLNYEIKNC